MFKTFYNLVKILKIYKIVKKFGLDIKKIENMEIEDVIDYLFIYSIIKDDIYSFITLHKLGANANRTFINEYNGFNLHAINENYIKPIHYVIIANKSNSIFFLDYLIDDCNISPNELDGTGRTPINFATLKNNFQIIEYLLDCKDIDLTINKNVNKPIINILNNNSIDDIRKIIIIKMLVERNINIDEFDNYGVTPFMVVTTVCKDIALFNYFISNNCNPYKIDKFGNNILHYACKNNNKINTKIIEYILKNFKNIDINKMNDNMETPISIAFSTQGNSNNIIKILENYPIDYKNIFKTALENNPQILTLQNIKKFVDKGANLNIKDRYNNSIIMKIANKEVNRNMSDKEIYDVLNFLINKKVDISIKNREGKDLKYYLSILSKNNNKFLKLIKKIEELY